MSELPSKDQIQTIVVYGFGPVVFTGSTVPCKVDTSSFVCKVYAFCSYNKIPFQVNAAGEMSPRNQRCPWIRMKLNNGKPDCIVEDSQGCIQALSKIYNIDMDAHLTEEQKIESETLRLLAENTLYFSYLRTIWVDHPEFYFKHGQLAIPHFMKGFVVKMMRKYLMIPTLNTVGNGDLSTQENDQLQATIYKHFVNVLGKKKFMFSNDNPSLIDVYISRFVDRLWETPQYLPDSVNQVFDQNPQFKEYGLRLQETFFTPMEHKRIVDEGLATCEKARKSNTKKLMMLLSGIVAVLGISGYFICQ
eukprot:PhM_4_TR15462/c0_g1_i1/m.83018